MYLLAVVPFVWLLIVLGIDGKSRPIAQYSSATECINAVAEKNKTDELESHPNLAGVACIKSAPKSEENDVKVD